MRTGHLRPTLERLAPVMEILVFAAILSVLTVLSLVGWVADSRDGADWAPTMNGLRAPARH